MSCELKIDIEAVADLPRAIRNSDIASRARRRRMFFVCQEDVSPGTFIAAVGADDGHKQEIDPTLIASTKVVADDLEQICSIGDTHHAISRGLMAKGDVYAELSEIVAGRKPARKNRDEIIVFDSTGVAIEDAAAAAIVYEKALAARIATSFRICRLMR